LLNITILYSKSNGKEKLTSFTVSASSSIVNSPEIVQEQSRLGNA